uniref:Kinesin-like protein n=1 Tax=Albugo laibachii Nc14 TaxID=890382 RepID=F0WCV5_9STRA|nr:kinesinlike protein putative [Albugo laibachii Nc14]|eukprot:CCA19026.1 kinesinlike protein putative [Albugo laibachii Nc14]
MTQLSDYNVANTDEQDLPLRGNALPLEADHRIVRNDTEERRKHSLPSASTLNTLTNSIKNKPFGSQDRECIPLPSIPRSKAVEEAVMRKLSFSSTESILSDDAKVQVVIRIRPLGIPLGDGNDIDTDCYRLVSKTSLIVQPPKTSQAYRSTGTASAFEFTRIFSPSTAQPELFEETAKPILKLAFRGQNGLIFAYGVTNSGKTYTITGTDEHPGLLPRSLEFIFDQIKLRRRLSTDLKLEYHVTASYLEVYNECVYDLLIPIPSRRKNRRSLRLFDRDGKVHVQGLLEKRVHSFRQASDLLAMGKRNKQVAETKCNSDSSRGHCVFTIKIHRNDSTMVKSKLWSKISIVDLAGSERGTKTGATGIRLQEATKINGSLMNLMNCFETLRWNQQHPSHLQKIVPFRQSKLTKLFQESFVGRDSGPLVMIVAVNPSIQEFDETLRTLKYSAVARELVRPKQNASPSKKTKLAYNLDGRLLKRSRVGSARPVVSLLKVEAEQEIKPARESALDDAFAGESGVLEASACAKVDVVQPQIEPRGFGQPKERKDAETQTMETFASESENRELEQCNLTLRKRIAELEAESLRLEVDIRQEVASEMAQQLRQFKEQFKEQYKTQHGADKENIGACIDMTIDSDSTEKESLSDIVDPESAKAPLSVCRLRNQLQECEEEMKRMQNRHKEELIESAKKFKHRKSLRLRRMLL